MLELKKYFSSKIPCGSVDVFVGRHPADRRLVHLDVVGHVAQVEGPQVVDALVEELALVAMMLSITL